MLRWSKKPSSFFFIKKHCLFSLFQTFLWFFIHLWWCFPPIPLNVKILEQNTDCFLATFLCCPMFSPNNISHSECQPPNKNATTSWLRLFTPPNKVCKHYALKVATNLYWKVIIEHIGGIWYGCLAKLTSITPLRSSITYQNVLVMDIYTNMHS